MYLARQSARRLRRSGHLPAPQIDDGQLDLPSGGRAELPGAASAITWC